MRSLTRKTLMVLLCVALCFTVLIVSGCKKEETREFPEVTSEPTIKEPEVPIVWPFTGLEAPSADAITKRPISVKIENSSTARPQTGLNSADVVYETIAEGGITRFNCIFQSTIPKKLGPVRSARLSDVWIVPQFNTMLFFSGANSQVLGRIKQAGINNMSQAAAPSLYSRSSAKAAPHNLFLSTSDIDAVASKKGFELTTDDRKLNFALKSEEASSSATNITIPFSYYARVEWKYDAETDTYKRAHSGTPHTDAATGKQVRAKNVVVMWAKYTPQSKRDAAGSITYDITLGGEGKAVIFKNGAKYKGTWKASAKKLPRFFDKNGKEIKLNPGNTWFEVPPTDIKIKSSGATK